MGRKIANEDGSGAHVFVLFQGEVLPYKDNRIELDPVVKDDAGIPVPKFFYEWHDNEGAMFKDMIEVGNEILQKAGAMRSSERMVNLMKNNTWKD